MRLLWEQLVVPWILWATRVDAVYTTHNLAILFSPVPSIILVQNVEPFFLGRFPNAWRLRPRLMMLRLLSNISLRRSLQIIAISEWERDLLVERLHVPHGKIVVAYPGVTAGFHPPDPNSAARLRERLGLERPYLLCVTRLAGYGNLLSLAKAYASLVKQNKVTIPLVVAGGVWDARYVGMVRQTLEREGCAEGVRFLGYVPHSDMPLLMGNATCFLFPSLLEACGNVLLEALACGAPILFCRRRPMTDICGDAAVYFDGENPADIAAKLFEVLGDATLRATLARHGPARTAKFSWRRSAEIAYGIFEQLDRRPLAVGHKTKSIPSERST